MPKTPPRRFSEAWDEFRHEVELSELAINPDEIFDGVRDTKPGRDRPKPTVPSQRLPSK